MFTCPSCESEVKQGQKFCGECGSKIDLSIYLKTAVSICQGQQSEGTQCGTELTTAVKFCPECSPPVPKDINEQADNVDPDGSGQGQVDNASLQGSIKITEEAVSKLNTYDAQTTLNSSQPNPENMAGGLASADISHPNPASMPGGQASTANNKPHPASMPGGQASTANNKPNPASMPGGQASTNSSQPNLASMPGGQVTTDSSQPNLASMPGGQVTTNSSQPNPASMPGGQVTTDSSQPNPASMPGGQVTTESSQPNPASMPEGQVTIDSSQPNPASMPGGQASTDSSQPNPANMAGGQASTDSSQPNPANMAGGLASTDSSQPNPANMAGGLASTDSSQPNPANMAGGLASADSSQPNPAKMEGGQESANSSQPNPRNMPEGQASTDNNTATPNQQNEAKLMEKTIPNQSLTGNQSMSESSETFQSANISTHVNVNEQQQPVFGGAIKERIKEGNQEEAKSELPLKRFQDSFIFKGSKTVETGEIKINKSMVEKQATGNDGHQEDNKGQVQRSDAQQNMQLTETSDNPNNDTSGLTNDDQKMDDQKNGTTMQQTLNQNNGTPTQQNDAEKQQLVITKKVETDGQGHGADGQQILKLDEKQDNLENLNKGNDAIGNEGVIQKHHQMMKVQIVQRVEIQRKIVKMLLQAEKERTNQRTKIKESKKKERKEESKKENNKQKGEFQQQNSDMANAACSKATGTVDTIGDTHTNLTGNQGQPTPNKIFAEVTAPSASKIPKPENKNPLARSHIDVCFHVIVAPTILANPEKDVVVVAFEKLTDGWDSKRIDEYMKQLKEDAEVAILAFQPAWQLKCFSGEGVNGEEMISKVAEIDSGLRKLYVQTTYLMDGQIFNSVFSKILVHHLNQQMVEIEKLDTRQLDAEARSLCLLAAVTITHFVVEYQINLQPMEKDCYITESVLRFTRDIARLTIDPSWMCCVPIIHFMGKYSKPFEDGPTKINHDDDNPVWWGISKYADDVDYFKAKTEWDSEKACPYFEVDYLLPRTMLASLKLEVLHAVVTTHNIPTDISLASTIFYLKKLYGVDKGLVRKLIVHVSKQCYSDKLDVSIAGLVNAYRTYRIAADLLTQSLKLPITNKAFHLPATETFLTSLDTFDKIQEKLEPKRNEYTNLNMLWNEALKVKIPSGRIKDVYIKHLADSLRTILQKMGSEEELIEIYLDHSDSFVGVVQEILSKVAFKCKCFGGYCQELLKKFVDIIQDYIQQLLQGNIVIRDLINLSNKHDNFQKVLIAMKIENAENIMMTIKVRIKEFDAFKTAVQIIQQFVYYTDTSIMETKLKVFSNPAMVPLSQLVKTVILEDLKNDIEHYRPIVTVFELSSEDLAILPKIPAYCKGFLFLKIWEKKGIELERKNGKLLPLNEVFLKFGNHHLNYGRICVSN
ncbi:unnamed protein product [Mytilus edulis]|uniref:DZANK-type domain-containing protein n=1 Tax=Mytilus edulis TaxID=6550 RepID=A0A8S3VC37_MYTED|nr:unnamed protein product [Mytilus edulis]